MFAKRFGGLAAMLGVLFVATVVGEAVPALKELEALIARHESRLLALTMA